MKASIVGILAICVCASNLTLAQTTNLLTTVVPKSAESNDTTYGGGILTGANFRHQQVYGSNEFSTGPIMIEELRFRPDRVYGKAFNTVISNIQINLSTTQRNPAALSSTYAQNVGADDTVVFQGSLSISSQFVGPVNGPKAFDMIVPLSQPFVYNPANGHLVVDVRNFSGSTASATSGQTGPDTAWRALGAMGSTAATIDSGADAIQIVYAPATNLAPIIVTHPTNQTVLEGGTVTFGVTVIGSLPFSFQWRRDVTVIPGATNSALTLTNVQSSQAGNYSVIISNAYGVVTSQTATLAVNTEVTLVVPRLNENAEGQGGSSLLRDAIRLQQVYGSAQFPTGQVLAIREIRLRPSATSGSAFTSNIPNLQINMSTTPVQPDALSATFNSNVGTNDAIVFSGPITVSSRFTGPPAGPKGFDIAIPLATPFVYNPVSGNLLVDWRNYSGSSAALVDTANASADQASRVFALGASSTTAIAADSGAEVLQFVYTVQGSAPVITSHPTNKTVMEGSGVTFSVSATGTLPLAYQWRRGAIVIPDATNSTLVLTSVQLSQAGNYSVLVSNLFGVTTSQTATLTVYRAPSLADHDLSRDFSLAGNPNGAWSYGRQDTIGGAFTLLGIAWTYSADNGVPVQIWAMDSVTQPVIVHNETTETATTDNGEAVYPPETTWFGPGVEGQPGNYAVARLTVPGGGDGTYEVVTTARPNYSASLQLDTDFHVARNNVEIFGVQLNGSQTASYTNTLALAAGDTIDFAVGRGADDSYIWSGLKIEATLDRISTNGVAPVILSHPTNQVVVEGGSALFGVNASGSAPLSYQWRKDVTPISGATSSSLLLTNVQLTQAGGYSVVVSNALGMASSQTATLTVTAAPPAVVMHPTNQTVMEGSTIAFSVVASGTTPLRYHWRRDVTTIPNATNSTLILMNVQLSQAGEYSVVVSNLVGVVTSETATLTVYRAPSLADHDLSRDFSLAGNPNGVWSYGRQDTIGGAFTLLGIRKTNFSNVPVILWAISASSQPAIQHNDTTQTAITDGGQGLFPPETTWFAPGVQGQTDNYAVARLRVPVGGDGTYELMTWARPTYEASLQRDTDFHVARNNVEIFGAQLNGTQTAGYTNTLALAAGDTIDFAVGRGADNSYIWSGLKVEVELTRLWSKLQPTFTNAVFTFGFDARRGDCAVEASTNLINWVTVTNVIGPSGRVNIADPAAASHPYRFYRVRLLQ